MGDRPDRGLIPQPSQQTPEHHLQITASLLDGRVGRLVQDPSQILVPLGGATTVVLLGTFIFSGTGSHPRGQFRGRRERTGTPPSAMICCAESTPKPGTSARRITAS